ncbi:MAG: polymerase sigma-70 factor, subfamily [Acidimicrobiaceae bacterium]
MVVDDLTRLALAAADGDRVALAAFVRRSQGEVWRLCAHLVDRGSADDLTQDVYLRAIPALESFQATSSARTWLLSIARHTCADALRSRMRRRTLHRRLALRHREALSDPTAVVDLAALLPSLDADRREAFVLTQIVGLSYAEAAEVCACPIGTVRSRVARARAQLIDGASSSESTSRADRDGAG